MKTFKKIISYPLSALFYLLFILTLLVFHPLQWLALNLFGAKAHRWVVNAMNFMLIADLLILGVRCKFKKTQALPVDRPVILVSNHQGMFDIPLIIWFLRKHKPKFISKIELAKGIPSISYNLKHGGNALIDRKDPSQSIPTLQKFGKFIAERNFTAVIFPEGTRSRDGKPKKFASTGLKVLIEQMPNALIVPMTINHSWKLFQYGNFPLGVGFTIEVAVHEPKEIDTDKLDALLEQTEEQIKKHIV